jgi:Prophage CP4-57 regulatory protein (AlpA)
LPEPKIPKGPLIRRKDFPEHGVPTKEPKTIDTWIEKYGFPKPYRLGYRTLVWSLDEIQNWMATRKAA